MQYKRCKQCNKNVYRTWAAAEYFAENRSTAYYQLKVYPCHHGNGFHVSKYTQSFN